VIEMKSRWASAADKEKWAARGASFVAKAKATKLVWFPPKPVETGRKAASTATRATKGATKGATRKSAGAARKSAGATKKRATGTKRLTNPVRRKQA
jgi:hypothetical protein